jgi:hypothetical protein
LDLAQPVADAFTAGHIGVEHALLIAKLVPDMQEKALAHCFDGYFAANDAERSLVSSKQFLLGCVESTSENKDDDPLATAAALYRIDAKALRTAVAN